jgi:hypothetical protein
MAIDCRDAETRSTATMTITQSRTAIRIHFGAIHLIHFTGVGRAISEGVIDLGASVVNAIQFTGERCRHTVSCTVFSGTIPCIGTRTMTTTRAVREWKIDDAHGGVNSFDDRASARRSVGDEPTSKVHTQRKSPDDIRDWLAFDSRDRSRKMGGMDVFMITFVTHPTASPDNFYTSSIDPRHCAEDRPAQSSLI